MYPPNVDDIYALTPMQRLMLLHSIKNPAPAVLANQVCYEVHGSLRADLFRRAWGALVARHAALRTAILWKGLEEPVQVVRSRVEVPFAEVDLSDRPQEERQARIDKLWRDDADKRFELARAPLMRCTLARLSEERHFFIWNIHHLVVDRWSHGTLFADLSELYRALLLDETPRLPSAAGFRDYIAWLTRQNEQDAERFWREELRGFGEATLLADGATPAVRRDRRTTKYALSAETTGRLQERASSWRTTPASLILAAVGLEIARRHRSTDVVCGVTVSGRPPDLDRVEQAVGCFVNNVPMRFRIDRSRPVSEWVRDVQRAQLRRQPFEWVSLAAIRDETDLPPAQPLFDLFVVLNLTPPHQPSWPGVELRPVRATFDAGYPLVLGVTKDDSCLELTLVHNADFERAGELLQGLGLALQALASAAPEAISGDLLPPPGELPGPGVATPAPDLEPDEATGTQDAQPSIRSPRTDAERVVVDACRDLLGLDEVNLEENFFDLGGYSLLAVRLVTVLGNRTGVRLDPIVLVLNNLEQVAATLSPSVGAESTESSRPESELWQGATLPSGSVYVTGYYFGRSAEPLFGIHHSPIGSTRRPCAVLVCGPVGWRSTPMPTGPFADSRVFRPKRGSTSFDSTMPEPVIPGATAVSRRSIDG